MSSHHIIRENQEPALFIAAPHSLADDYLNQLLEWSPTVITLSEHYELLKSREIKIDVILDNQALDPALLEENLTLLPYSTSYWQTLFDYLQDKKNFAVYIINDQVSKNELEAYLTTFTIILLKDNQKFMFLKKYEKWHPKGNILEISDLDQKAESLSNLDPIGNNSYQVIEDGFVSIPEQDDFLLIAEEL